MPVGRYFRGLTTYDLLGNLIPGVVMLVVILGFLPSPPIPHTLGGYGLFTVFAFTIGSVIQFHASKAVGEQNGFEKTINTAESLPTLTTQSPEQARASEGRDCSAILWTYSHPIIGPLAGWRRPKRGEQLDDAILANRIWEHLVDTHELPFRTDSYDVLYHLMSSRVDDVSSPSRATRMQAIRNFNRGMWLTAWYSFVLFAIAGVSDLLFSPDQPIGPFGSYMRPAYFEYWSPIWQLILLALLSVIVFWIIYESVDDDYLEYLFIDYAIAIGRDDSALSIPDDAEIEISGAITTHLTDQTQDGEKTERTDTGDEDDSATQESDPDAS